jgi:hypothetical protein
MKLARDAQGSLFFVDDAGARRAVPEVRLSEWSAALMDYSGERARWDEATLHRRGETLVVRVLHVIDHEGGTDRNVATEHTSADGGVTWIRAEPGADPGPELARVSTAAADLGVVGPYKLSRLRRKEAWWDVYDGADERGGDVAVEILTIGGDREACARVEALAAKLVPLRHLNLVAVHAFVAASELGPALVCDRTNDDTLADRMKSGPLTAREALSYANEVLAALEVIHDAGLVHGDLRPSSISFQEWWPTAKLADRTTKTVVADAGLLVAIDDPRGTRGTARTDITYVPFDALRPGAKLDATIDVYALGQILWEALAGKPAFHETSTMKLAIEKMSSPPAPLATFRSSIAPELSAFVERAMANPTARFPNARAMREALSPLRPSA